jgi:prevent-host-death family protein
MAATDEPSFPTQVVDGERVMSTRQLAKHTSVVINHLVATGEPITITLHGEPVARLVSLSDGRV